MQGKFITQGPMVITRTSLPGRAHPLTTCTPWCRPWLERMGLRHLSAFPWKHHIPAIWEHKVRRNELLFLYQPEKGRARWRFPRESRCLGSILAPAGPLQYQPQQAAAFKLAELQVMWDMSPCCPGLSYKISRLFYDLRSSKALIWTPQIHFTSLIRLWSSPNIQTYRPTCPEII